jgi:hypothetical protein
MRRGDAPAGQGFEFPASRENSREFENFRPFAGHFRQIQRESTCKSSVLARIPCWARNWGIFSSEQAIASVGTAKSWDWPPGDDQASGRQQNRSEGLRHDGDLGLGFEAGASGT